MAVAQDRATDNETFRRIVNGIPGFVCTLTETGDLEFVSDQVLEYFGRSLDERWRGISVSIDVNAPASLPRMPV
jgi:hypothetical protein